MLKELTSDCWSHEPCHGVQDGDATYCWEAYICIGSGVSDNGHLNGGSTMVKPRAVMRAFCSFAVEGGVVAPPGAGSGYMLMIPVQEL
jgi:hypothetical protein